MRQPSDIVMLDGVSLSNTIKSKQISCVEVMNAYLDHIDGLNPHVNAIVSLQDREALLIQARDRDEQLARGEYLGWMHGFPQAIKDLEETRGIATTFGSPLLRRNVPAQDSIVVERMKRAGSIVIGKTNVPEFGAGSQTYNPVFGTTFNAYDQSKTCGGSSGGAGVCLALRMLPVADGSDQAGSLRNPAAFNNVFGFRTTFGRVPLDPGRKVFLPSLSVVGPMARTVPDLAALLSVQAGYDPRAPLSTREDPVRFTGPLERDFKGVRVAWLGDLGAYLPFEPGVLDLCKRAVKVFAELGCSIEEAIPDHPFAPVWQAWMKLRAWEWGLLKGAYSNSQTRALLKPELQWEIENGLKLTAYDVSDASMVRSAWYHAVRAFFDRYDYLILPSAQVFPFDASTHWPKEINGKEMDTYHRWMEVTIPATMAGCPALSVPAGFNAHGLPMGIQIMAPNHAELSCLQLAYAYDQATNWVNQRSPHLLGAPRRAP